MSGLRGGEGEGVRGCEGEGVRGCEGDSCIRKTQILLSMLNLS